MEFETAQYAQDRGRDVLQEANAGMAGSTADLFPRLVTMQRQCGSRIFALLVAEAHTLLKPGKLVCAIQSPGSQDAVAEFVSAQAGFLLHHLDASPCPLIFTPDSTPVGETSPAVVVSTETVAAKTIAFPVQLGAMGNGFVVFFDVHAGLSNDLLIDLHRKSLSVMREKLRLAFGLASGSENLNDREIECLQQVGNGMKSEAIGELLNLSVHTVNAYLGSATTKLNAVNRIQAIAKAIRLGIIA
ncbi:helix-turn-helix transcriptional regulator [Hoeflea sp. YIM 152468]|uniref:response regulator transcription factor n=1 Tax=Hoeflea sp. YIM 152468 TaxID=3031759 RepID=UPI0023DCB289|nr:helix-turn-helix transcriptional regulator [Hoeflea sp. YIM 152468]MDF1608842.1 helix-turn-helix transcriptional regulator [Hoeflea sp. YIM 152468]